MTTSPARPPTDPPPGAALQAPSVLSTLNDDGSRKWLRPRVSKGRFLRRRRAAAVLLIALFTALPFLQINGKPAILLDVATRHFTLFGKTFLPTDTLLLALLMIGIFVTVFWFTALLGRVWCGWACPQTVYMEFVFRPIERFFEGAPGRVKKGRFVGSPPAKILKYAAYLVVSVYLAHTFLSYFVGVEELARWVRRSPLEHPASFLVMAAVTALMMFDFCYFREQTCIVACPYGRFQSVMLDRSSLIISYDEARGEPRGKARRAGAPGAPPPRAGRGDPRAPEAAVALNVLGTAPVNGQHQGPAAAERRPTQDARGDCVDCGMCVATCPTGIDIRNGLQMECVACAQCIDACDAVMAKLKRPLGLIRYNSEAAMTGAARRLLRPRVLIYPVFMGAILTAFILVLQTKGVASVLVLRGMGAPFTVMPDGMISNPIRVKVTNRTEAPLAFTVGATGPAGASVRAEEMPFLVPPGESRSVPAVVVLPPAAFSQGHAEAMLRVSSGERYSRDVAYRLMGPGTARPAPEDSP